MASASVVGLDSESSLFAFNLTSVRKKLITPRKASREKMMFRRSSGSGGDCGSVTAEGGADSQPLSPGPTGDCPTTPTAAQGGMMPGEGCGAPRSPDRDSKDCDSHSTGTGESQLGRITGDRNSNIDCDSNHNTSSRRGTSLKRLGINVMTSETAVNGHKATHRDRDCRSGDGGHKSISGCVSALEERSDFPLERLTQGRTGVVKLARQEPSRREAWSIFTQGVDPRVKTERGEGHRFEAKPVPQDWCDACSRKITAQALKCQNCSYTCHLECQSQVQLDCNQRDRQPENTPSPRSNCPSTAPPRKQNEAKVEEARGTKDLSQKEVQTRIKEYNAQVTETGMKLGADGSFTGFIKVHLRLSRPVTVPDVEVSGSEGASKASRSRTPSEDQEVKDGVKSEKRTSFYLPCDCVKQIHISSLTTTREVIQGLLKKFMVLDNPSKFALYRLTHRDGQDLFQKLPLNERPLLLRLIAGPDPEKLSFVLKENETGEVEWHAFSVPELQNFLVILKKEETERVRAVMQKYATYRQKLQQALQQHDH